MPKPARRCSGCQSCGRKRRGSSRCTRCTLTPCAGHLRTMSGRWSFFAQQVGFHLRISAASPDGECGTLR